MTPITTPSFALSAIHPFTGGGLTPIAVTVQSWASGILWIGDPHASSKAPGRRVDDYESAILNKLRQCAEIANKNNLRAICLGDLLHRAKDNSLTFLARLADVLREFKVPMLVLAGSHDLSETTLSESDAMNILALMKVITVVDRPGLCEIIDIDGYKVNVWAAPAYAAIPTELPEIAKEAHFNVLMTHHNINFNGTFPGAHELAEIPNCDMLVNGHQHGRTKMMIFGRTACHNPGSLGRVAWTEHTHKPVVSIWTPAHGPNLQAEPIKINENVFNLAGHEVEAVSPGMLKSTMGKGTSLSAFAAKMTEGRDALGSTRTSDGEIVAQSLQTHLEVMGASAALKQFSADLLSEAVTRLAVAK